MRIIFAGTPDIAAGVLQTLISAEYNIVACLTQPDRPQGRGLKLTPSAVKILANSHDIPVLQPKTLKDAAVQQQLVDLNADLMIVMAYGLLLPTAVLTIPKLGCINIHASILPRWRGAAPIQHAILAGDLESGITIMQMDSGLDTGAILATFPCEISATDTSGDLHDRLAKLAQSSCLTALRDLEIGSLKPTPQSTTGVTYANKIEKQQAKINWHDDVQSIHRCIRAYNPWPIAFTSFKGENLRIWEASIVSLTNLSANSIPGTILKVSADGVEVATGKGILKILTLQFPSKKPLPISAIVNSPQDLIPGAIFE